MGIYKEFLQIFNQKATKFRNEQNNSVYISPKETAKRLKNGDN